MTRSGAYGHNADTGLHLLTALALKLVLVTGQRPGEVAGMHRDEIKGRVWTIPASRRAKTETAQSVYLGDTALAIIAAAKAEVDRLQKREERAVERGFIFETAKTSR
jgi:integrase